MILYSFLALLFLAMATWHGILLETRNGKGETLFHTVHFLGYIVAAISITILILDK